LGIVICLAALAGCSASSDGGQVQQVGDGTYSLGVPNANLGDKTEALNGAIAKAGAYCHAMGQKLQMVPNSGGDDVRFRCAGSLNPSPAEPAGIQDEN
jgi:hypothetical protein